MPPLNQPRPTNSFLARLARFAAGQKLTVLTPIVTAILGAVGFWLSPLKQRVYDSLYPPRILVKSETVCLRNPLMRGDTFMVRLHLISEGNSLSPGEIAADVPTDYLELEEGNVLVDLDGTEKTKVVTYRFDALKAGTFRLTYVYNFAKGGSLTEELPLSVVDRKEGFPTFADLSGLWELVWENSLGELNITQQDSHLTGSFSLSAVDGTSAGRGKLSGFTFGNNIEIVLQPGGSTQKVYANLLKVSEPNRLTICGRASAGKDEAFIGQIANPTAAAGEICKGANLLAKAFLR
jgi:hypothetical protein